MNVNISGCMVKVVNREWLLSDEESWKWVKLSVIKAIKNECSKSDLINRYKDVKVSWNSGPFHFLGI